MISQNMREKIDSLAHLYHHLIYKQRHLAQELTLSELPELVYNSNAIENSTLTLKDTEDILIYNQIRTDHDLREIYEAKNLADAITYLIHNPEPMISIELILRLHRILLNNICNDCAGRFRRGKEWVRVGTHIGANPEFVPRFMHDLIEQYYTSDGTYFLDKIAYFHAELENIHPFNDGNGRIGRLLINEQLDLLDLPPIIIPNKAKNKLYYPALESYTKTGQTDQLADLFAGLLIEALHRRITKLTARRIVSVSDWAKSHGVAQQTATNKAIRGTIPAFRLRDHWMIDADFQMPS